MNYEEILKCYEGETEEHANTPLNLAYKTTFITNFFIVMTGIELFILIGGGYALYTVGMAIATNIDYYSTNKEEQLIKRRK